MINQTNYLSKLIIILIFFTNAFVYSQTNWEMKYKDESFAKKILESKYNELNDSHNKLIQTQQGVLNDLKKTREKYEECLKERLSNTSSTIIDNSQLPELMRKIAILKRDSIDNVALLKELTVCEELKRREKQEYKQRLNSMALEIDSLKQQLIQRKREIDLQQEMSTSNKNDCDSLIGKIQTEYKNLSAQLTQQEDNYQKLQTEATQIQTVYNDETTKNAQLEKVLTECKQESTNLGEMLKKNQELLFKTQANLDTAQRKILYHQKRWNRTIFVALNYSFLRSPTRTESEKNMIAQIGKSWDYPNLIHDIGFAIYTPIIGIFFSNPYFNTKTFIPSPIYNINYLKYIDNQQQTQVVGYTPIKYKTTIFKGQRFNIGLNAHIPYTPLYIFAGMAVEMGSSFDLYEGNLSPYLLPNYNGLYATSYKEMNTQKNMGSYKGILGIAYVNKFFQAEIGYSQLNSGVFVNIGTNFPFNTITGKRVKTKL